MRPPRRFRALVAGLLAVGLVLTGCTAPRPEVTFFGGRAAVEARPALWCQVDTRALQFQCPDFSTADYARLTLRPGQSVQINVPAEIADQPWQVAFQYADAAGRLGQGRTALMTSGELAYTLHPLAATDLIRRVEVQTGLLPTADGFVVTRSWVLETKLPTQ